MASILTLFFPEAAIFRALRSVRALRMVVRSPQLKVVFISLWRSFPAIANVVLFISLFWIMFAILGVSLFAGKYGTCNDANIMDQVNCIGRFNATCT